MRVGAMGEDATVDTRGSSHSWWCERKEERGRGRGLGGWSRCLCGGARAGKEEGEGVIEWVARRGEEEGTGRRQWGNYGGWICKEEG
ncbi:hypothetical protein GOBAR_DD08516 [Gossypium barbadense]|nr:hypothetical protein GOBAR_DD08516 [Gossypium barbadense]